MDQTLDPVAHLDERAKRHQLGDPAVYQFTYLVGAGELLPRILLSGLQREADALTAEVDLENLHLDLVTDSDYRTGVVDVLPRQLRHVHEAVHAAEVDESTEVDDAGHGAIADLSGAKVVQELFALFLLGLFKPGTARQDHVVAVLVQFDDLGVDRGPDEGLQVTDPA